MERSIHNPVTGERVTFLETSRETGGARTVGQLEVQPGGGVPLHRHGDHEERIDVMEGEIAVILDGVERRLGAGSHVVIGRTTVHRWWNPSPDQRLKFRATMTPGNSAFEGFLRLLFGLARDGRVRPNGLPRRFADLALCADVDPSVLSGPLRLLGPLLRLSARRTRARGRAEELFRRYGVEMV
jgi:quercetin dioxygenase-like cupin family protein